jgi:hypothetical protein
MFTRSFVVTVIVAATLLSACKTKQGGACAKPDDCGSGLTCAKNSTCQTPKGAKCVASDACSDYGQCTPGEDDSCVIGGDADCASSSGCKKYGECRKLDSNKGPTCGASAREDCANSMACREWGYCAPVKGGCSVAASSDCANSTVCKVGGRCSFVTDLKICMAASIDKENNIVVGRSYLGDFSGCCAK